MKIVIVGNGIAGNEVAFSLRERTPEHEIKILSAEKFPEYDPCSLPYYIGGDVPREVVFRRSLDDYQNKNITLVLDSPVVSIDPHAGAVVTAKGEKHFYNKLVLAHGGRLFIPPIEGVDRQGVLSCKLLGEADKLSEHGGSTAVVIGSGAIGVEAAEALKKKGYVVYIIELLDWILPALFDEATARRLEAALRTYGIQVLTAEKVLRIDGDTAVTGVVTDKREIPCDTVVIATGVVPGTALAQTAGIEVERGIKVNSRMETSVEGIYACGDCVETIDACTGEDVMFQLKHNATEQARIVARNILGMNATYTGAYAFARAHFFDTHAVTFGKTSRSTACLLGDTEVIERENGKDYLRLILLDGKVAGGQAIGTYADSIGLFMGAMWRQDDIKTLRKNWVNIVRAGSPYPWIYRKMGWLIGLSATDVSSDAAAVCQSF
ncbi:MAG: NAD(P)/FAD-dependent oxidoreductase [Desulfobacterales bacterium]|nr:MAG: NAD(P)/FAD-dependent oxidoreductase [Desulfobacterales bacterium]